MIGTSIKYAVQCLTPDGVIALPTEAVYGLSCDPDNAGAIEKLLALKQRDISKGLILVSDQLATLLPYIAPLTDEQQHKLLSTWPGPVTWVVPKAAQVSRLLAGDHDTIAIRVTAHPLFRALCNAFGKPLVSTSANLNGAAPAKTAAEVAFTFPQLGYILDGALGTLARPTQIRDLLTDTLLRE